MAERLVFDGANDYCTFPNAINGNIGTSAWTFEIEASFQSVNANGSCLLGGALTGANDGITINSAGRMSVMTASTNRITGNTGFVIFDSTVRVYRIEHDAGGAFRYYRDGVLFQSGTFTTSLTFNGGLGVIGKYRPNVEWYVGMNLVRITVTGFTNSAEWSAALSGGTGSTLPTTAANNNATLINFPTDNSQWQGFAGGTAYADTLQAGAYTSAGSQLTSTIGYSSALQAGLYSHSGSALGSAAGYASSLQGGSFSYSGSELQSIVSNGAQNYTDTLLGGSFAHSGSILQSAVARNSALLAGSYSHSGSSLTASLAFYSSLNGGSYSHFGSALQSTVSGEVTVSIEGYTITFAADDVSGAFAADMVAATFINDYVSATWSN